MNLYICFNRRIDMSKFRPTKAEDVANPTWNEDTEKVYSLWQKLFDISNEANE